jgi:hypothetical protein
MTTLFCTKAQRGEDLDSRKAQTLVLSSYVPQNKMAEFSCTAKEIRVMMVQEWFAEYSENEVMLTMLRR